MIAGEFAALADHAMAGDHERHRVLADCGADRTRRLRRFELARDIGIGGEAPHWNLEERFPHPHLEIRADKHHAQRLVLPPALGLAEAGAFAVILVKPQFEVGRQAVGKGGVVKEAAVAAKSAENFAAWLASRPGWTVDGVVPSPILGGDGNREFLVGGRRSGGVHSTARLKER